MELSDDKSKEILSILRKQMNDSAIAEETYTKVQNQLKLHQKINDNVFDKEERFLYYTGVKKFPDLESEETQEIDVSRLLNLNNSFKLHVCLSLRLPSVKL